MKLRLGVLGAGSWALASHLPNLARRREDVEFVGVCRPGRETLQWIADAYGFTVASEDHTAILDAGVDIVVVSSPTALHYQHARDALLSGAHVLVEKPFTLTSAQAWDLVSIAEQRQLHLLVAFGFNYKPLVRAAQAALTDNGGVGPLEVLSVSMASVCRELLAGRGSYPKADPRSLPDPNTWSNPEVSGGGYAQAQLTHALGLALHLFDAEPERVFAQMTDPMAGQVEQHVSAVVSWRGQATGVLSGNATHEGADRNRDVLRVHAVGGQGQFRLDLDADAFHYFRTDGTDLGLQAEPGAGAYDCDGPPNALVDLALDATATNPSPGPLGARTVQIIEALYASARSGKPEACRPQPQASDPSPQSPLLDAVRAAE